MNLDPVFKWLLFLFLYFISSWGSVRITVCISGSFDSMIGLLGPSQFSCLVCGIEFKKRYNCLRHVKTIHMGLPRSDRLGPELNSSWS